jgi:hypothetical protein
MMDQNRKSAFIGEQIESAFPQKRVHPGIVQIRSRVLSLLSTTLQFVFRLLIVVSGRASAIPSA